MSEEVDQEKLIEGDDHTLSLHLSFKLAPEIDTNQERERILNFWSGISEAVQTLLTSNDKHGFKICKESCPSFHKCELFCLDKVVFMNPSKRKETTG